MKKRCTAMLIVLAMLFTMLPGRAYAVTYKTITNIQCIKGLAMHQRLSGWEGSSGKYIVIKR